jgi:hypothetical protein
MTSLAADFDHDGVVGSTDFDHFRACVSGPRVAWSVTMRRRRLDCDGTWTRPTSACFRLRGEFSMKRAFTLIEVLSLSG